MRRVLVLTCLSLASLACESGEKANTEPNASAAEIDEKGRREAFGRFLAAQEAAQPKVERKDLGPGTLSLPDIEALFPQKTLYTRPYKVKAAIVVSKTSTPYGDQERTVVFDDYGAKQFQEDRSSDAEDRTKLVYHQVILRKDQRTFLLDMLKKTGEDLYSPPGSFISSGGASLDPSTIRGIFYYKGARKEAKQESVADKLCDVYSVPNGRGFDRDFLWRSIPVKVEGLSQNFSATSIAFAESIPATRFEAPADITLE